MQSFKQINSLKRPVIVTQSKIDTKANLIKMSALTIESINLIMSCSNNDPKPVDDKFKPAQSSADVLKQVEYLNELIQSELTNIFNPSVTQC